MRKRWCQRFGRFSFMVPVWGCVSGASPYICGTRMYVGSYFRAFRQSCCVYVLIIWRRTWPFLLSARSSELLMFIILWLVTETNSWLNWISMRTRKSNDTINSCREKIVFHSKANNKNNTSNLYHVLRCPKKLSWIPTLVSGPVSSRGLLRRPNSCIREVSMEETFSIASRTYRSISMPWECSPRHCNVVVLHSLCFMVSPTCMGSRKVVPILWFWIKPLRVDCQELSPPHSIPIGSWSRCGEDYLALDPTKCVCTPWPFAMQFLMLLSLAWTVPSDKKSTTLVSGLLWQQPQPRAWIYYGMSGRHGKWKPSPNVYALLRFFGTWNGDLSLGTIWSRGLIWQQTGLWWVAWKNNCFLPRRWEFRNSWYNKDHATRIPYVCYTIHNLFATKGIEIGEGDIDHEAVLI